MLKLIFLFTALSTSAALGAAVNAEAVREAVEEVEAELIKVMRKERVAGAVLVIVYKDRVLYDQAYGESDARRDEAMTLRTPFPLADYAKIITAMAVVDSANTGKLDLDAPVTEYLPDVRFTGRYADARSPTLRELLTHHGGLANNQLNGSFQDRADAAVRVSEFERVAPPGVIYGYSHLGFELAGRALETVHSEPLQSIFDARVIPVLGATGLSLTPPEKFASPHNRGGRRKDAIYARDTAAMGLYGSANDMARVMRFFLSPRAGAFVDMMQVQNEDVVLDLQNVTGLAWQMTNTDGHKTGRILRQEAIMPYYRGAMILAPDEDLGVFLYANSSSAGDVVSDVSRLAVDMLIQALTGREPPPQEAEPDLDSPLPDALVESTFDRFYNTGLGLIELEPENGSYEMHFVGRTFGLEPAGQGWYAVSFRLFGVFDLRISVLKQVLFRPAIVDGRNVLIARFGTGTFLLGDQVAPMGDDGLARFDGDYELLDGDRLADELDLEEIELEYENGVLRARYELPFSFTLRPETPLVPAGDRKFIIPGLGTNMGGTATLWLENGTAHLVYSGWHFVRD